MDPTHICIWEKWPSPSRGGKSWLWPQRSTLYLISWWLKQFKLLSKFQYTKNWVNPMNFARWYGGVKNPVTTSKFLMIQHTRKRHWIHSIFGILIFYNNKVNFNNLDRQNTRWRVYFLGSWWGLYEYNCKCKWVSQWRWEFFINITHTRACKYMCMENRIRFDSQGSFLCLCAKTALSTFLFCNVHVGLCRRRSTML